MSHAVFQFNHLMNEAFDLFMRALAWGGEPTQILGSSVALGIGIALIFSLTLNITQLKKAQNELRSALYEIWLYRIDPWLILRAQKALFMANLRYLKTLALPLTLAIVVSVPLFVQMHFRFGLQKLTPGTQILLSAEIDDSATWGTTPPQLQWVKGHGEVQAVVHQPALRRIVWRLQPQTQGENMVALYLGDQQIDFPLYAGNYQGSVITSRTRHPLKHLLHPRGRPLADDLNCQQVYIGYPSSPANWLLWFTLSSLIVAWTCHATFKRLLAN